MSGSISPDPNTTQATEVNVKTSKYSWRVLLFLAAAALFVGAAVLWTYQYFWGSSLPEVSWVRPVPAISGEPVTAKFIAANKGDKVSCLGKEVSLNGVNYRNLVIATPSRSVLYIPIKDGNLYDNDATFSFSFTPNQTGTYQVFPCRTTKPAAKDVSPYKLEVIDATPPEVSENKPPAASRAMSPEEKLKKQITDAVLADLKNRGLLLSEADRSKLDEARTAKARMDAAEAIARSAKADLETARRELASKVPNTDFKPVLERGIENAKTLKEHAEQMEVWKNDLASVKEKADTAQKDVGTVLAEQSIQKENIKSVAAVTLELAKDVQGTVHTKVNKTFGFIGGTEIKDTKEFKKVVDYRKQREDLASKIAELERIAGRYQNVVAQAPDATNSKKMKKRQ